MRDEKIIENVQQHTMAYLQSKIAKLADHSLVGESRGFGFLGAIELVKDKETKEKFDDQATAGTACRDNCLKNNLVMRSVGDIMLMSPPLIMTKDQIDDLYDRAWESLDDTQRQLSR